MWNGSGEYCGRYRVDTIIQTDGWTDGHGETSIHPFNFVEQGNNKTVCIFHGIYYITRSRRNPRSRCAWLTGLEPRWGYARTSFGVDAAAEVTISKCNLWKSWTLELTSEFSHAHLTIFSTVWDAGWSYQDHASRVNAKPQKIYQYFVG